MTAPVRSPRLSGDKVDALSEALTAALAPDRVATGEDVRHLHGTDESVHAPAPAPPSARGGTLPGP